MPPRHRSKKNKDLEGYPNLYEKNGYYSYRRPDGVMVPLGKIPRNAAKQAARDANTYYYGEPSLLDKITGTNTLTVGGSLLDFQAYLNTLELAPATLIGHRQRLIHVGNAWGSRLISDLTISDCDSFLNEYPDRQYNAYRSLLSKYFDWCVAKGHHSDNPASITLKRKWKRACKRLTKEGFDAIYQHAEPHIQRSMSLALITLQRRADILKMRFQDIKDCKLYVIQNKTKKHGDAAYIRITIGTELSALISQCKDMIGPQYLIHYPQGTRKAGEGLKCDALSRGFKKARDLSGFYDDLEPEKRPPFREIRAFGSDRLLKLGWGKAQIKALMGHTTEKMTDVYLEGHEPRWVDAESG